MFWGSPKHDFEKMHAPQSSQLFTRARTQKQARCRLTDEWIRKMRQGYAAEYYSAVKNNQELPFAATWMDLEAMMQSEIRQADKGKY